MYVPLRALLVLATASLLSAQGKQDQAKQGPAQEDSNMPTASAVRGALVALAIAGRRVQTARKTTVQKALRGECDDAH